MANVHGVAGEWARVKGTALGLWPLFLGVFAAGASCVIACIDPLWGLVLVVVALTYSAFMLLKGMRRMERFYKGARGEERVAGILRSLPDDYHIFNDFVACGKHVDHVVACPAGVFAVETKFWRGRVSVEDGVILVDGEMPDRNPLDQVLKESKAVQVQLARGGMNCTVTPVLAFASDTFEAKIAELHGAVILNSNHLRESFSNGRTELMKAELDRLVRIMESNS